MEEYRSYIEIERGRPINTVKAYLADLKHFQAHFDRPLERATPRDVRAWMGQLKKQGCKNETISRKLSSLRQYYRFLLKEGTIEKDPLVFIESPKREKRLPVFLTQEEVNQLIEATASKAYDIQGKRDYCIISILYRTGLRNSELVNLRLGDIQNTESGISLRVFGKGSKERIVPLSRKAQDTLTMWKMARPNTDHDYIFTTARGKKTYPRYIQRRLKAMVKKAGIDKPITPHKLRHTFATHLLHKGEDIRNIQELLGHASIATTQIYTHADVRKLSEAVERL